MPLRFDLGPFEKLFIGKSVLTNNGNRTMFVVEGETPILRAKDVLTADRAVSAVEKLYHCVQQMYLEEDTHKYQRSYVALVAQAISGCPEYYDELKSADRLIVSGHRYDALKSLKRLIGREAFHLNQAETSGSMPRAASRGRQ